MASGSTDCCRIGGGGQDGRSFEKSQAKSKVSKYIPKHHKLHITNTTPRDHYKMKRWHVSTVPGLPEDETQLDSWGGIRPPDPPNKSAWRPPKWLIYIRFLIQFQHLGGLQADLLGGSGGADAPPGIKLSFVFWQPRDSNCDRNWLEGSQGLQMEQIKSTKWSQRSPN